MRLKYLLFIAAILLVGSVLLASADTNDDEKADFEQYKKDYNKTYGSGGKRVGSDGHSSEESEAYKNYKKNRAKVQDHNNQNSSYVQKVGEHDDKSDEEKKNHFKGSTYVSAADVAAQHHKSTSNKGKGKKSNESDVHASIRAAVGDASPTRTGGSASNHHSVGSLHVAASSSCATVCAIQPSMDLRPNMSTVKDQRNCSANWAMAPISLLEFEARINKSSKCYSDQSLVDCDPYTAKCSGGDILTAMYWMMIRGVPFEANYLYTAKNQTCRNVTSQYTQISQLCYTGGGNESIIIQTMNRYFKPLVALLSTGTSGFMNYAGGIFADSKCSKNVSLADVAVTSKFFENYFISDST